VKWKVGNPGAWHAIDCAMTPRIALSQFAFTAEHTEHTESKDWDFPGGLGGLGGWTLKLRHYSTDAPLEAIPRDPVDLDMTRIALAERPTPRALPAASIGALAVGVTALGALAIGAVAFGAVAIGRLAVGRLLVKRSRIDSLTIGHLTVERLSIPDTIEPPPSREAR
jgi:hypothetical protein